MSIKLMLYPFDHEKNEFKTDIIDAVVFTFGEMNVEYYNTLSKQNIGLPEHSDYGYYVDNVIRRGTNIITTLTGGPTETYGVLPSDFLGTGGLIHHKIIHQFKISDDLYLDVHNTVTIWPGYDNNSSSDKDNEKAQVQLHSYLYFKSPNNQYELLFTHPSGNLTLGTFTYDEYVKKTKGENPFYALTSSGWYYSLNAYPTSSETVASYIETGCLIQSFNIEPVGNSFFSRQYGNDIKGVTGSIVQPLDLSETAQYYVPLILGLAYKPEFPDDEEPDIIIGKYDNDSDGGGPPLPPEQSALRSGMIRMYQMSTTQLNQFANFLWSNSLTEWDSLMNNLKQWFTNPLDSIISLTISPIDLFFNYKNPHAPSSPPEATDIKLGGFNTGVQGHLCSNNYIQFSLGKLSLHPFYGSYLDCNPHTSFSIYLPYIGFQDLDSDVLFSKARANIEVVYTVDVLTGVCVANIVIEKESNGTYLKHVIYTFTGNTNTTIPITSANMRDFLSATVGAIGSAVAIAGSGGTATPLVVGTMATQSALNVASQKVNIAHSGGMSLEAGMFGIQYAYLIVTRPREARPYNYLDVNGLPSELSGILGEYSGFTQVSTVHVNIEGATEEEKQEIERLLKEGIIL